MARRRRIIAAAALVCTSALVPLQAPRPRRTVSRYSEAVDEDTLLPSGDAAAAPDTDRRPRNGNRQNQGGGRGRIIQLSNPMRLVRKPRPGGDRRGPPRGRGGPPQRVGSIRSARLIDYELVPMYQGLLAFAGASIGVDKRIYGSEQIIANLCADRDDTEQCYTEADAVGPAGYVPPSDFVERAYKGVLYGPPYFFRDPEIPIPHNLFANLEALWQLAEADGNNQPPDLHGMAFHEQPQGEPDGSGIYAQIRYRTTFVEWHYDPETGRYYRSSDGQPHYDANTEEQISAANVVLVYAGHYLTDIVESQWQDTIHWSVQITVWPEGDAVILRDGVRYEGRWLRPSRDEMLSFQTYDGDIIYLKPGNTWFQLLPLPEQMDPANEWVDVS